MQLDMTGFMHQNNSTMYLITDYVNKDLTEFLQTLITTYVKQPVDYTKCGYGCSDHASWYRKGYITAMPLETSFKHKNPDIHTNRDTMEKLSLNHMTNFAKLAVAFAIELAEPTT